MGSSIECKKSPFAADQGYWAIWVSIASETGLITALYRNFSGPLVSEYPGKFGLLVDFPSHDRTTRLKTEQGDLPHSDDLLPNIPPERKTTRKIDLTFTMVIHNRPFGGFLGPADGLMMDNLVGRKIQNSGEQEKGMVTM